MKLPNELSEINTDSAEGKMLFAVLGDVTSRPKYVNGSGEDKPSESWNPNDAVKHYAEVTKKIFN